MTIKDELNALPSDGIKLEDIGKETEEETSEESQPEIKSEEEKETEDEKTAREAKEQEEKDNIPFHKHPRFKALVEEKNQYKEELDKLREDVESKFSEIKESRSETVKIPSWFTELYGDNEVAWGKYQEHDKETRAEIKRELREEFESEAKEQENSSAKWNTWIDDQVDALKDEGLKFDKNELMKVMMDYKPSDDAGNLDFKKGYEIMEVLKKKDPEKSQARKELVDDSGKSKAEPQAKAYFTPEDMRGKGWG
jgi:hypothetical protein